MSNIPDPWATSRDPYYAEARAGRVLCGFHTQNPDVGDPGGLEEYCPDCEVERYYDQRANEGPPPDEPAGISLQASGDDDSTVPGEPAGHGSRSWCVVCGTVELRAPTGVSALDELCDRCLDDAASTDHGAERMHQLYEQIAEQP